jgi:hypothetical protein
MAFVVFTGQSNAGGAFMTASTLTSAWSPDPLTLIWNTDRHAWEPMDPGHDTGYPGQPEAWGPEVEFAREFRAVHPDETLRIIKLAYGGTGLARDDGAGVGDWSPESPGEFFDTVTAVIKEAGGKVGDPKVDAVFFGQGEEDASNWDKSQAYLQNLTDFVAHARQDWLRDAAGKIGIFQIDTEPGFARYVRDAQAQVDASDANVLSFDADPLPRQPDHLHFTASSYDAIGQHWEGMFETWRGSPPAPPPDPPPKPPSVADYEAMFANILRAASDSPAAADARAAVAADLAKGGGAAEVKADLIHAAGQTTSVATLAYEFFTGAIPSAAGTDYLVSPTGPNPANLNAAYYQHFNLENRYINFAVNLGVMGEGHAAFQTDYGQLSLRDALGKAYAEIFGAAPSDEKATAILTHERVDYLASYGGDGAAGLGTKAAMVGWLLAEAVKADVGVYAKANDAFLGDLADGAPFAVDIVGVYGHPEDVFHG